jgi:hypothetical protein
MYLIGVLYVSLSLCLEKKEAIYMTAGNKEMHGNRVVAEVMWAQTIVLPLRRLHDMRSDVKGDKEWGLFFSRGCRLLSPYKLLFP